MNRGAPTYERVRNRDTLWGSDETHALDSCEYRRHAEAWMQTTLKVIDTDSGEVLAAKTLNARRSANA